MPRKKQTAKKTRISEWDEVFLFTGRCLLKGASRLIGLDNRINWPAARQAWEANRERLLDIWNDDSCPRGPGGLRGAEAFRGHGADGTPTWAEYYLESQPLMEETNDEN